MAYESRNEQILRAMIDGTEYTDEPQSRIETLLLELKETIEAGGGGGEKSEYLIATDKKNIACEATLDNFDSSSLLWGDGDSPIMLTAQVGEQDGGVFIPVKSSGTFASVDRKINGRTFTAYIVAKALNPSQYSRLLSSLNAKSKNQGIILYGNQIMVSSWDNDTNINISSEKGITVPLFLTSYLSILISRSAKVIGSFVSATATTERRKFALTLAISSLKLKGFVI